jgi:hypothetical protein
MSNIKYQPLGNFPYSSSFAETASLAIDVNVLDTGSVKFTQQTSFPIGPVGPRGVAGANFTIVAGNLCPK